MFWIKDTYQTLYGKNDHNAIGWVTGKPLNQGGIEGRIGSVGLGLFYGTKYLLNNNEFWKEYKL